MPAPPVLSSEGQCWENLAAFHFRHPPSCEIAAAPLGAHLIVLHLAAPSMVSMRTPGTTQVGRSEPGQIMVMAAHQPSEWRWDGEPEVLHVHLGCELLADCRAEAGLGDVTLVEGFGKLDPVLWACGSALLTELRHPDICSRMLCETIALQLTVQLVRRHAARPPRTSADPIVMTSRRLRRSRDFIEDNLAGELTIGRIADHVGLSRFHFAHCFKRATGMTPRQYVLRRRVERARQLLERTDLALAEIGLSVGFASQSHFTAAFRKLTGTTPWRHRHGSSAPPAIPARS
jgi:AraC family transcriptional regulator